MSRIGRKKILPFLDTFGSGNKRKGVWKQGKQQKVSRNGRKRLPFLDTIGSRKIKEKVTRNRRNGNKFLETGENVFAHF